MLESKASVPDREHKTADNRVYFHNHATKETRWRLPSDRIVDEKEAQGICTAWPQTRNAVNAVKKARGFLVNDIRIATAAVEKQVSEMKFTALFGAKEVAWVSESSNFISHLWGS